MTFFLHRPIGQALVTALLVALAIAVLFLVPAGGPSTGARPFDQGPPASVDLLGGGR